jgi:hypothetical protein
VVQVLITRTEEVLLTGGAEEVLRAMIEAPVSAPIEALMSVPTEALASASTEALVSAATEDAQWSAKTAVMAWYPVLLIEAQLDHRRCSCMTNKGRVDSILFVGSRRNLLGKSLQMKLLL